MLLAANFGRLFATDRSHLTERSPNRTWYRRWGSTIPVQRVHKVSLGRNIWHVLKSQWLGNFRKSFPDLFFPIQRAVCLQTEAFSLVAYFKLIIAYCQFRVLVLNLDNVVSLHGGISMEGVFAILNESLLPFNPKYQVP